MPKDELTKTLTPKEIALDRQVEMTILGHQEAHDGEFPTQLEIQEALGGSMRELNPSIKRVRTKMEAVQSLLAKMPEMPDQLRLTGEQFMKEIWATAREKADADLKNLRLAHAAKEEDRRRELQETEQVLFRVEETCEAETARAKAAEARILELEAELAERTRERDGLQARLDERIEIFAQLGLAAKSDTDEPAAKDKPKARDKALRGTKADEEPETAELPMT